LGGIIMKVAAYARYSSENQREESIEAQLAAIEEFCQKEGHIIVATYIDRAMSATTDNRPEFLRMIGDAKKGIFEAVVVHKLDRFARNRYDSAIYKRELKKAGVVLLSVTERLDDSPESIILESVLEGMAEYYSKNLAREVMKGLLENAKEAKFNGGIPPLGYDVDPATQKYVVNEEEAKAVRLIFDMYLNGQSYKEIIAELNKRGYRTKLGRPFGKNSLHDLLRNPIYAGYYVYGRGKKAKDRNNFREDRIVIPDAIPAIITKDEHERVMEKMKENRRRSGQYKAKREYIFSGLVECAHCGGSLIGNCAKGHLYYICNRKKRVGDCPGVSISQSELEKKVFGHIMNTLFSEENMQKLAHEIYSILQEKLGGYNEKIAEIEKQIRKLEKERENLIQAIAAGIPLAGLKKKAEEIEKQIQYWQNEMNRMPSRQELSMSEEEILQFLRERNEKVLNSEDKKAIAKEYVQKIKVYDDKVEISFNLPVIDPTAPNKVGFYMVEIKRIKT